MCTNSTPVWQALQAFDTTHSGLVKQDVLRAVLSSFIFPMNPHSFQKLTSRYGVRAAGPVRWKHFLGHFMSPLKEDPDVNLQSDRALEKPLPDEDNFYIENIYPRLKEIFHLVDTKDAGWITRADMRHLLERPGGTQPQTPLPRLRPTQITELLKILDPGHTGVIQLASLEKINPSITSSPSPVNPAEPLDETEDTAEQEKTPDEKQTTECSDKVSVASASWRTVENLLLDKLCEQLSSVLAALKLCDPQQTGHVTQEDLKKVLSLYGMPISDTHFKKLCETSSSRPGSSSELVYYTGFLRNLGVPLTEETCSSHSERPCTSPQLTSQSVRTQRPPSCLQVSPDTCNILDIVFRRMRSKLEQRHASLTDRIQAIIHSSDDTLTETDVRKILEDSWVILDDKNFNEFTELLGFRDGRIERSAFLAKYEEATGRDGQQSSEGHGDKHEVDHLLISAEQCLAAMKTRIKIIHGDNLTAFRWMDRKRRGVVDCHDFKRLYSSLGFLCREEEYQRLLDLISLHPGGNLNYAEFVDVVENNGKRKEGMQSANVLEQLHALLASEARYKWADMSKVLCQFDTDGHGWIHKKSLRGLLFTYALPMRSDEFEQLWLRYDPERQGCVAVCDFLEKLGFHHEGELMPQSQRRNQTAAQQDTDRPVSSDTASLECIKLTLQENYEGLSNSLTHLETRRDGTVTVEQLLSLLQTHSCSIQREQLVNNLRRLNVSLDENCRLAYMEFLSALDQKAEKKDDPPPASPDAVRQIESLDSLSPGMAMARMRELVTTSAPNLQKAFLAFDRGRTGMVKALEFRQVLDSFCARLSDKQYRYMLTKLELDCENCTVNWKDFLNKFQSQSTLVSADRCLSRTSEQGTKTRLISQTKPPEIAEHLQQIQEVVSGHLYEITKELMGMDPTNSTTVSKEQFRQLCDRHCLRLTNDQFECVWSQMPVNEQKKLQYREFLKRFGVLGRTPQTEVGVPTNGVPSPSPEPRETVSATKSCCSEITGPILQRTKSAPQCTSRRSASTGRPETGSLLGSTERRLRGEVQRCWKEIQRNCTEEDPQQEGHISTSSFLQILQSLSICMTHEQFEHLAVKFDIMSNGFVSYHKFLRHFLLNLKPAETKGAFERRELPLPVTPTIQGVLSKDCVEVMLRIYEVVRSSWTSIRRYFLTSDRAHSGTVSVQDFRKVLRYFNVNLSEEEFFHLTSYFDANTTGKIYYNNFLWAFLH
ncbi:EF-hand calcium-binding domain-containing protein 6 [Larimichthys crocea]|uniref:EF-hand calcium-binding domain-containing protein 6 n=1 Tax=Larimichthys crocea TaxID=215358 RepID=UPI000F5EFC76|nr:EF-hand calcium-binding domain-containing protein 6 [Larimichthys crocea]